MRSFASFEPTAGSRFAWSVRVRPGREVGEAVAAARSNLFTLRGQASFRETDAHPSAVEYLLGALGGDLLTGFAAQAKRAGIEVYALEVSVSGELDNPLVHLGVVGEEGRPGLGAVSGTLYVSADAEEEDLAAAWQETLRRSPLVDTLQRATEVTLALQVVP